MSTSRHSENQLIRSTMFNRNSYSVLPRISQRRVGVAKWLNGNALVDVVVQTWAWSSK